MNTANSAGYTPLHLATATGNSELVVILLASKADTAARCPLGPPIDIAETADDEALQSLLAKRQGN